MKRVLVYLDRDLLRWKRGRVAVVSNLVMPAAWLIFVGLALPIRFTDHYLDFITPGILILTVLSTSLQGGSLLMFDKVLGFLNKFLALPAPRESILLGKILFITLRGIIQATIILIIAVLIGASLYGPSQYALMYLILFLFGALFAAAATTVALYLEDHDSYAAFNTMISMPLFFTSTALIPYAAMPEWLKVIASVNPLSIAIDGIRAVALGIVPLASIGILTLLGGGVLLICLHVFRHVTV